MKRYWTPIPFLTLRLAIDREGASLRASVPSISIPLLAWSRDDGLVTCTVHSMVNLAREYVECYEAILECVNAAGEVLEEREEYYNSLMRLAHRPIGEIERRRRARRRMKNQP